MTVETRADCEEEPLSAMLAGFVFVILWRVTVLGSMQPE